jgi:hypothetical protein
MRRDMPAARSAGRSNGLRLQRDRLRIAQVAARIITEHGLTDWTLAKRKAARQLMLPDAVSLPSNEEIEAALADHQALFGGESHAAQLRTKRVEALGWMRRLARWQPLLVGGVAAGWATEHTDARIELITDDPKAIEIALASDGIAYKALTPRSGEETVAQLRIDSPRASVLLAIMTPQQRRERPRRRDEARLDCAALSAMLDAD